MFLNDIKHDWIGKIPNHWDVKRTKHLFHIKKEISETPEDEEILSLTFGGIIKRDITTSEGQLPETYNGYTKIYPDDIVMNPMDLRSGWVDRSRYEGIISPSYYVLNKNAESTDIGYFNYQFQRQYKERIFFPFGQGVSYDYRWGLGKETLLNFPIIVPPPSDQKQIISFLDHKTSQIDTLIEKKQKMIERLKEGHTAIINHVVTKGLNSNVKMKDSGIDWIGDIPEHWEVKSLRYIGNCQNGVSQGADYFGSGFPFVSYGNVYSNLVLPQQVEGLAKSTESDRANFSVKKGDVFFTRTSETIEEIGLTSTCLETIENAIFAGFLIRFRPFEGLLFEGFSKYYFRSQLHRISFVKEMNLVTRASLSQGLLKKMPVFLPSIEEQQQIAEYLDTKIQEIDTLIDKENKRIELLREYRQSLISEVITGKIDVRNEVTA